MHGAAFSLSSLPLQAKNAFEPKIDSAHTAIFACTGREDKEKAAPCTCRGKWPQKQLRKKFEEKPAATSVAPALKP